MMRVFVADLEVCYLDLNLPQEQFHSRFAEPAIAAVDNLHQAEAPAAAAIELELPAGLPIAYHPDGRPDIRVVVGYDVHEDRYFGRVEKAVELPEPVAAT